MRNVTYVGLCWAMTFGMVAVALAQQPSAAGGQPASQKFDVAAPGALAPPAGAFDTPQNAASQNGNADQQHGLPAPGAQQDRSMLSGGQHTGQTAIPNGQQRGELGVWLVESGGPGVEIQRITRGSAAEQAGLRPGDIVLQVNGRGASSPQSAAQMIRQIPIGQHATLMIWRDGDQKQLQATIQAVRQVAGEMTRDPYQVGFRGEEGASNGDSASRFMRLEQQIASLKQELQQMRQEMSQLRAGGNSQSNAFNLEPAQSAPPQETAPPAPGATPPAATSTTAPPPGFGQPEEKAAKPTSEPAKSAAPPAAEKPAADPFGAAPAQPKTEEKPKADTKGGGDDLFK